MARLDETIRAKYKYIVTKIMLSNEVELDRIGVGMSIESWESALPSRKSLENYVRKM